VILFHLFGGKVMRFSDLERAIPNIIRDLRASSSQLGSGRNRCAYAYPQVPAEG